MTTSLDLAALLCSRLCHDLLSPVGAINNGLELLADERDPAMRQKCVELLEQSARVSADKLKFFRLAFGAAGGFGEYIPTEEPRDLLRALVANNERVRLDWGVAEASLPKPAVKIMLNLAGIGLDALVRGGTLEIHAETNGDATEIAVRATGARVAFDENIGRALAGELPVSELSGRTAPAHMVHLLAAEKGGGVQYALADGALVLGAVVPGGGGLIG